MRIVVLAACACLLAGCASDDAAQPAAPAPSPASTASNAGTSSGACFWWPFCGGSSDTAQPAAPAGPATPGAPAAAPPPPPATASVGTASSGGSVFGLFGGSSDDTTTDTPQLGVNAYLWRATLDTLTFMPLASEDPVGGVIITDWYSAPENPNERMKVTAYILDKRLRADALKIAVFRQTRTANGWADAQTNPDTAVKVENAILTRARQLHLASTQ